MEDRIVRDDVPFGRAESKYGVEQVIVIVEFCGGELKGVSYIFQKVDLPLDMLRLRCSSLLDIFGTVLEPCFQMFLVHRVEKFESDWRDEKKMEAEAVSSTP
ncbi:hypothetical protein VNO77_18516 [Canavalia gladiata]|uniref:Uncharacterized protein n=1 Tax=Canavalia gladiata TaxID=3824 RepID=A0AAN9QJQ9_CANGL